MFRPRLPHVAAILAALIAAVYGPAILHNEFVLFDDTVLILDNDTIREISWRSIRHIFTSYDPELYIPLTLFSFQINHALSGMSPQAFHATNALLHLLNTMLIFLLVRRITRDGWVAAAVASLFAVHPLHAETVLWASARKDTLSTAFLLGSWLAYLRFRDAASRRWLLGSVALLLCALLAKVTAVVLLPLLLLMDWYEGRLPRGRGLLIYLPHAVLAVIFILIALPGKTLALPILGPLETALLAMKGWVFYARALVWPSGLAVTYSQLTPIDILRVEFLLPAAAAVLAVAALVIAAMRGRAKAIVFWSAAFFLPLVPNALNNAKNGFIFFASDRYAYLASVGVLTLAALGVARLLRTMPYRSAIAGILLATSVGILGWRAKVQANTWRNTGTLFENAARQYPDFALAYNNIGGYRKTIKDIDGALEMFLRATELEPGFSRPFLNIANIERERGNTAAALEWYARAVAAIGTTMPVTPDALTAYYEYGQMLDGLGRVDDALAQFRAAAARDLPHPEAFYNLGVMAHKYGKADEAIVALERAVDLAPEFTPARYRLASLYAEKGRLREAYEALLDVQSRTPGYEQTEEHLRQLEGILGNDAAPAR
ncbi:MAG: hypothetical protein G01um101425_560 [Candidatus Peregrinibacteria bacterium Gr01-1014_25]|nr:MAG: hypothetical protein G01um101425_560 [Candidatus Peregrinibacteria bacterium Gr01-1014_25]